LRPAVSLTHFDADAIASPKKTSRRSKRIFTRYDLSGASCSSKKFRLQSRREPSER
jgi:hypothetical protein